MSDHSCSHGKKPATAPAATVPAPRTEPTPSEPATSVAEPGTGAEAGARTSVAEAEPGAGAREDEAAPEQAPERAPEPAPEPARPTTANGLPKRTRQQPAPSAGHTEQQPPPPASKSAEPRTPGEAAASIGAFQRAGKAAADRLRPSTEGTPES